MTTGTTPETGKGNYFTLRKVTITPAVPKVAEDIKITGDIYLFGIPFLALAWITAGITIPKAGLDITNPVILVKGTAFGGHFSLDVPGGVSRQGSCSVQISMYGGPTYQENEPTNVLTIPPFPSLATVPKIVFTVSGTIANDFTVGKPTVTGSLLPGSQVNLSSQITNTTDTDTAVTIKLQVYNQGNVLGITYNGNTVTDATIGPVTIPAGGAYSAAWVYTEGPAAGSRDVIITVLDSNGNTVGAGTFNGLYQITTSNNTFTVGTPSLQSDAIENSQVNLASLITNTGNVAAAVTIQLQVFNQGNILGVTYNGNSVTKATIGPVTIPAGGAYSAAWVYTEGPAAGSRDVIITVLDSNGNTVGAGTFNRLYQVTAPTQTGTGTFAVGMPGVVGTLTPGSQVALVSTIRNTTDTPATVTIQLQVFNQGNILGITYNGNSVTKATIGPVTIQAGALYSAEWIYTEGPAAGSRDAIITVLDSNGNTVGTGTFDGLYQVTKTQALTPQMVVSPASIVSGQSVTWTFYNFTPGQSVGVSLIGGGGLNVTANALGSGTGSFIVTETVGGPYGIQAQDSLGEYAMALFTVTVPATPPPGGGTGTVVPSEPSHYADWVTYTDGSTGWEDDASIQDELAEGGSVSEGGNIVSYKGPYASGTTVTL